MSTECCTWYVSTAMARHVETSLDSRWWCRWVRFVDLTGARVRVLARQIVHIEQSTPAMRATGRALCRSLRDERKADRSSDEDD